MRKRGPDLLRSGVGILLLGAWGTGGWAQEIQIDSTLDTRPTIMAAAPAPTETQEPVEMAETPARLPAAERLVALQAADLDALQAARDEAMKAAQEYTEKIPELRQRLQQAFEEARTNSPEVKAMRQQIADLEVSITQYLQGLPQVTELTDAIRQAEQGMLEELNLRTALGELIARRGGGSEERMPAPDDEAAE